MGDSHGGFKSIIQCLERSKFNKKKDALIHLGDITDGFSEPFKSIKELMSIKNLISITGNHDIWIRDFLSYGHAPEIWLSQGGLATLKDFQNSNLDKDEIHKIRKFFKNQKLYYIDKKNRLFVHGGYIFENIKSNTEDILYWDRSLWQTAQSGNMSQNQPKILDVYKEIYIGHTTTYGKYGDKPVNKCNVWNLDQGGGHEGVLSIMDINTKKSWQSDKMSELYPGEHR